MSLCSFAFVGGSLRGDKNEREEDAGETAEVEERRGAFGFVAGVLRRDCG